MAATDKRRKILDAAVRVFARHGFYNSKVSHIAQEAGVGDGTIYLYFKHKEDLLIQVFNDTMEEVQRRQEQALAEVTDPVEKLRRFVRVHFDMIDASPALAEVLTVEVRQSSKFMHATDMRPFGRYLGIIAGIVQEGQERGHFTRRVDPKRVSRGLFGLLDEYALEWVMGGRQHALDTVCRQTIHLLLHGLLPADDEGASDREARATGAV